MVKNFGNNVKWNFLINHEKYFYESFTDNNKVMFFSLKDQKANPLFLNIFSLSNTQNAPTKSRLHIRRNSKTT